MKRKTNVDRRIHVPNRCQSWRKSSYISELTGNWEGPLGRGQCEGFGRGALGPDALGKKALKEETLQGSFAGTGIGRGKAFHTQISFSVTFLLFRSIYSTKLTWLALYETYICLTHILTSCLPCIDILMTLDGLPKSTCKYWFLLFILAHQAPMYFPCRVRWSRPRNAAWYLSHCDEAFIWLDRRRPFCKPIGWLQSLPGRKKKELRFSYFLNNEHWKSNLLNDIRGGTSPKTHFSQLFLIEIASVSNVRVWSLVV